MELFTRIVVGPRTKLTHLFIDMIHNTIIIILQENGKWAIHLNQVYHNYLGVNMVISMKTIVSIIVILAFTASCSGLDNGKSEMVHFSPAKDSSNKSNYLDYSNARCIAQEIVLKLAFFYRENGYLPSEKSWVQEIRNKISNKGCSRLITIMDSGIYDNLGNKIEYRKEGESRVLVYSQSLLYFDEDGQTKIQAYSLTEDKLETRLIMDEEVSKITPGDFFGSEYE